LQEQKALGAVTSLIDPMKYIICLLALSLSLLGFQAHAVKVENAATQTNCQLHEKVFFSCPSGKKKISMCESSEPEAEQYIEYRYGTSKKIELRFKGSKTDVPKKFSRAEISGASNSGTTIWFKNNDTYYTLNAPVRGGPYLEVLLHGERIARLACNDGWGAVVGNLDNSSSSIETKSQAEFFSEVLNIEK
jgi:hypothetical protein